MEAKYGVVYNNYMRHICVKGYLDRTLIHLLSKYQLFMKLPQISHTQIVKCQLMIGFFKPTASILYIFLLAVTCKEYTFSTLPVVSFKFHFSYFSVSVVE